MNTSFSNGNGTSVFANALAQKSTREMCKQLELKIEEVSDAQLYDSLDPPNTADDDKVVQRVLRALFFLRPPNQGNSSSSGGAGGVLNSSIGAAYGGGRNASSGNGGSGGSGIGGGGAWQTDGRFSAHEREAMAACNMLQPVKNPRVKANSPEVKGGIFWSKMVALSREAKRFDVRADAMPDVQVLHHEQVMLHQQHPFLNLCNKLHTVGHNGNGVLCLRLDTLEFFLFCMCYMLVQTTAPAPVNNGAYGSATTGASGTSSTSGVIDVKVFNRLLRDYLEHFFPITTKGRGLRAQIGRATPWGSGSSATDESTPSRHSRPNENPAFTLIYMVAELWLHRYAPLRQVGSRSSLGMPPQQLLQSILTVALHVSNQPFQQESSSSSSGAAARSLQGVGEMKEHVRALQRPLFEFLLHCFKNASEQNGEELLAAVDVWVAWATMGGAMNANNADHHRRGSRMGLARFTRVDRRDLEASESQWVAQNYVFFKVLPLWWVGAAAKLARRNPEMAAKVVEPVVLALLGNKAVELVDEVSQLLADDRSQDPKRKLVVQPRSQYTDFRELMELTDIEVKTFIDSYVVKKSGSVGAHHDDHQSDRRFRELMRNLRQNFQDEDHEFITVRLRALLHIDPDSEQESQAVLAQRTLTKFRGEWGFSCHENGVVYAADAEKLPLGSRIIRVSSASGELIQFTTRDNLRAFLDECEQAHFEVQESSPFTMSSSDAEPWLRDAPWAAVVPYNSLESAPEPGYSDLADDFDPCGLSQLLRKLNRFSRQHPGFLFISSVVLAATRAIFGGECVLAVIVAGFVAPRYFSLPAQAAEWFEVSNQASAAVARFKFDFSFMFKSRAHSSPMVSLVFNLAWVGIFAYIFAWLVESDTLSPTDLMAVAARLACTNDGTTQPDWAKTVRMTPASGLGLAIAITLLKCKLPLPVAAAVGWFVTGWLLVCALVWNVQDSMKGKARQGNRYRSRAGGYGSDARNFYSGVGSTAGRPASGATGYPFGAGVGGFTPFNRG